jgi:nucleotide-binding universal stress UspA family protein
VSRRGRTQPVRSILVPVDATPGSRRAVGLAAEMASAFNAGLTLLHVAPVHELPALVGEVKDPAEDEAAQLVLGEGAKLAQRAGIEPQTAVRYGRPADQILRYAAAAHPDLIVMGTRALTGAKSVLLGSVSRTVSRRATCSVVLVR